ncbi:RAI1 like PD-XK nuclease-domain-containing protein [Schizophyllum fasciatum]
MNGDVNKDEERDARTNNTLDAADNGRVRTDSPRSRADSPHAQTDSTHAQTDNTHAQTDDQAGTPHNQTDSTLAVPGIWQAKTALTHPGINQCTFYVYERDAVRWNIGRGRVAIRQGSGEAAAGKQGPEDDAVGDARGTEMGEEVVREQNKECLCVRLFCLDTKAVSEVIMSMQTPTQPASPAMMVDKLVHMPSQWPEKGHLVVKLNNHTWLPVDLLRGAVNKIFADTTMSSPNNLRKRPFPDDNAGEPQAKARRLSPDAASGAAQPTTNSEAHLAFPDRSKPPRRAPAFQQPSPLISFSYTPAHELEFTDSALRYFVPPPRSGLRLEYGYERWVRRPDARGRLDGLLRALARVRERGGVGEVGIVAWRGIMTKILIAPYEERDGWDLNVMCANGTLYLEEHLTEAKLAEKNNMEPRQRKMTYYGYAFESYCTSATPQRAPGPPPGVARDAPVAWSGDVDTNVQWCSVVKTKLGATRMVIGGEVDCVEGHYSDTRTDTFVELKTSMMIRGAADRARFEKKLLKFYFQSFLLGVPTIIVGFRTPAGVVQAVERFKTMEIPRMVRGKPGAWDPAVCLAWGEAFVAFLKGGDGNTAKDGAASAPCDTGPAVWRVRFTPKAGVSVSRLDEAGVADVVGGEDRVGFLPRWYWEELQV